MVEINNNQNWATEKIFNQLSFETQQILQLGGTIFLSALDRTKPIEVSYSEAIKVVETFLPGFGEVESLFNKQVDLLITQENQSLKNPLP